MIDFTDSDNESELKAPILSDSESESGSESGSEVNSDSEWETDSDDRAEVKSENLAGIQRIVDSNKDSGMSELLGQPVMDCFTDISNNKFQDMEPTDVYRYIIKFLKSVNKWVLSNPDNMSGGGMIDMIHMMIGSAIGGILEQNPRVSKDKIAHIMIAMDKKYGSPDSKHSPDEDDDDEFILLVQVTSRP